MIIGLIKAWSTLSVIFMAITYIVINVRVLKGESSKEFLIARFLVAIAIVALEAELLILNILQGKSYCKNIIWACIFLIYALIFGFSLRNNNQQNKK